MNLYEPEEIMKAGKTDKQNRFKRAVGLALLFSVWFFFMGWFLANFTPDEKATNSISAKKTSSEVEESKTKLEYTQEEIQEAQGIIEAVKRYAEIYEEGSHLVVEFKNYVHPNDIMELASSIADADCVLNGGPRNIYFYDPGNNQIAKADFNCINL